MRVRARPLIAALLIAAPLAAQQSTRHPVAGENVALYNLAGTVRVVPGSGSSVVAEITLGGADGSRLRVETGDRVLRVAYPAGDIVYPPLGRHSSTELRVADDGKFGDGRDGRRRQAGRRVRISGDGGGTEAHADMRILVPEGKSVAVHLAVGKVSATNVNGRLLLDVASADVETSGTRGALTIDVGSGDVSVTDAEGELDFDTGSGNVTVSGLRAGTLRLDTGSGNVTVTGVRADRVELDAGSGDIRLGGESSPDLSLETGSGEVDITLESDIDRLHLESGSGDITVHAPASLGARIDVETGSGTIRGDMVRSLRRAGDDEADGHHLTGTIGDGRGTITVETGSGDVEFVMRSSR